MASYVGDLGGNTLPPDVLGGNAVDALVGQRITTGADNVTVLVIAQPSAAIEEITSLAERATDHLTRLKPDDAVMVLEQHGMPPTFVPPEYPLSWVTSVSHRAGGTLSTLTKAKAPFNLSGGRAVGTSGRGRPAARDTVPLATLVGADAKGKRGGDSLTAAAPKRRKQRLKDFEFGAAELAELAVALRAYVNARRDTSSPVTSWSNLVARKWPREYALSKQATGVKCTAQKVMAAIDENLLDRYQETWEWKGGWPAEARAYPPCKISIQHGA